MDFETMRQIRNLCREFMTGNTKVIEPGEQQIWSRSVGPHLQPYLYLYPPAVYVGYGLRRWDAEQRWWWLTGALVAEYRGRGLGQTLFEHLLATSAPEPTALEVRITNLPARRLYEKLGFTLRQTREDILVMTRPA
jgi:GNAT superfamily N-acetyltransferase